jgi:major inositol transporter-like SP family MFS transporter
MSNKKEESSSTSPYSITENVLEERQHHHQYGRISTQLYAGVLGGCLFVLCEMRIIFLAACLSALSFGTILGWSNPVTHSMVVDEEEVGKKHLVWLVCLILIGCSLGVTSCTFLMKQMGPKKALRALGPFYILTWWLMLIPDIDVQLAGRFFLGFLGISYSICGENLLMQTVHYGIRRYITVFHSSTMVLGVLVSTVVGSATSKFHHTLVCASIPILHYVLIQVIPESPVFLYATSHVAAAKSLAWYRGAGNFYMDMANIKKDWDAGRQDSDAYRYMLLSKVVYRALLTVMGVTFFQVCTGYFIFMFYNMRIWCHGKTVYTPIVDSTITGVCFVISKLFWGSLHSVFSWKVRGLLITSCFASAIGLTLLALYQLLDALEVDIIINVDWSPMIILALFLFFYDMGLNYYPKILIFEYMPFQMYKRAFSIVHASFWLLSFLNIYTFASTILSVPIYVVFTVLAGITYAGTVFCYFFVVEPKGKSLIQIQLEFGGNPIGKRGALFNQTRHTV